MVYHQASQHEERWARDAAVEGNLLEVSEAQRTAVVRLPKLLSDKEIESVHAMAAEYAPRLGRRTRPAAQSGVSLASSYRTGNWIDNDLPEPGVSVLYLHTHGLFASLLPELKQKLIAAARKADKENWNVLATATNAPVPRTVEYHVCEPPAGLPQAMHHDHGSLLTIDIMLSEPSAEFQGGEFQTLEPDGSFSMHPMEKGDALVFVSHKPHSVRRLVSGERRVLVMEIWEGVERQCGHRCDKHWMHCAGA
jgi:hypothetical protein